MTDITTDAAKALEGVTPGRAVQYHPDYCLEAKHAPAGEWDTSHDLSVIRSDGSRYWIGNFRHADDAMFDQWCRNNVPALVAALTAMTARAETAEAQVADLTVKLDAVTGVLQRCRPIVADLARSWEAEAALLARVDAAIKAGG